ncbi:MAG: FtsX-like permease family protein [Bifidobacteriaceae bacterium]|jgi:putative ABC transport system permease protein|nr:FtsX-like permease family protein [Bifidobacteriaceae bacterium]
MKHSALWKDAWRAISKNGKRFAAIAIICAVGVMMLNGLSAVGVDIRGGLDEFFDETSMHDVSVVSTMGLEKSDITALRKVDGVAKAAGVHMQSSYTKVNGKQESATVTALNEQGLDKPSVSSGRLPTAAHEVAVTEHYLSDSGKKIGDTLTFTRADTDTDATFSSGEYTIVGEVSDPTDIVNPKGPLAITTGSKTIYSLFTDSAAVTGDNPYTSAIVTFKGAAALDTYGDDYAHVIDTGTKSIEKIQSAREKARTDEIKSDALDKLATQEDKIDAQKTKLDAQKATIDALPDAMPQKAAAESEIAQAEKKISDAESKISDAKADINDMDSAQWHIRDRNALSSYADVKTESSLIMSVGKAFPVLFLVIAILVSLTAITRMIEEDRQLIGTYKALGYTRGEIVTKYVLYSFMACFVGGVIGDALGIFGFPYVMTHKLIGNLYTLAHYPLIINWATGIGGILLFVVAIVGSAIIVSAGELRLNPATLMLPKAPKAGKTIFLQRIGVVWNHLSFLDKVTARNLFRYKSRAAMVIVGVLGCTALVTIGFGMGNSALTLMPRQNAEISTYDALTVTSNDDHKKSQEDLTSSDHVKSTLSIRVESATLSRSGSEDSNTFTAQMIVVPNGKTLNGYINVHQTDGTAIALKDSGVVVTENAAKNLDLSAGSTVNVEDTALQTEAAKVTAVARNYTGNYVYMSQKAYEKLYGSDEDFAANADLVQLSDSDDADAQIAFTDDLGGQSEYLSVVNNAKTQANFTKSFMIFFVLIGFIVVMAAVLAFVVLYTLASTNISERERELATIKVLGFRNHEVHSYVNKEMTLLSIFGIILGLPIGFYLLDLLLSTLNMPGMNIVANVQWFVYVGAAALALIFTWLVSLTTNRALDHIDMVGALKSPE